MGDFNLFTPLNSPPQLLPAKSYHSMRTLSQIASTERGDSTWLILHTITLSSHVCPSVHLTLDSFSVQSIHNTELVQERDRLRFNGVRASAILETVAALTDSTLERKDLEAAIKLLEES